MNVTGCRAVPLPDQKQLTENLKTEKPGRNKMPVAEFFQVFLYVYAYYFDLSFEETVRRHNTRNREFGEKDMRRWWREKDFSSVLREQAITCEMDTDSIVEKIYSDLNADRKAIAFMSI